MHRRRRLTRRDAIWAVALVALATLIGGTAYAVGTPTQYNCTRTDRDGGWALDCTTAPSPSGSPSGRPSPSATQSASPSPSDSPTPSPTVSPTATTPPATTPPASPTPTTPSSTGPRLANCLTQLRACGYPDESTTGVPVGAALTVFTGNLTIRTGGTWTNLDIRGCVTIQTSQPVIIRNSLVHATGCATGGIFKEGAGTVLIEDVTSFCTDGLSHSFWVGNATVRRVRAYGCANGFELNGNSSVSGSLISAMEGPGAHGDGIQSQGGNDVLVEGNTFLLVNPVTSSIITNPTLNSRWTLRGNFFMSGAFTTYCSKQGTGWVVTGNRYFPAKTGDPHSAAYGLTDSCDSPSRIAWSDNYLDSNPLRLVLASGAIA